MNADKSFDSFSSTLVSIHDDSFPYVTRKTMPLDILKPLIIAELPEQVEEKHRLKRFKRYPITYGDPYRNLCNRIAKIMV